VRVGDAGTIKVSVVYYNECVGVHLPLD
jgi:hypothetical protein